MFIILDFRYKNAIIHISGGPDREPLEDTATRFLRKYTYIKRRIKRFKIREIYIAYYERKGG